MNSEHELAQTMMPAYSQTPRLKATHPKSPILMPLGDIPKRANSLYDQDMAFMVN